jgi:hypothetical protein
VFLFVVYLMMLTVSQWVLGRQKHRQQSHLCQSQASLEFELAIWKLKSYKLPGADPIPVELIQAEWGGGTLQTEIHKLIKLIWKERRIASPVEGIKCHTYSQKG